MLVKKETTSDCCTGEVIVSASLLSADFSNLRASIEAVELAGADWIHVDVMDGCFVPSLTIGPVVISGIRSCTNMVLDVHLMVNSPADHLQSVIDAGADIVTVHLESEVHLYRFIDRVKQCGRKVGVSIVPKTHPSVLEYVINDIDMVLVMSVDPGFGGQKFITSQLEKISNIRKMINDKSLNTKIAVDGGVSLSNAPDIITAGADILVMGTALFRAQDMAGTVKSLKSLSGNT